MKVAPCSPTFWANNGEVTKVLNAQYLRWGASCLSFLVNTLSTSFTVDVVFASNKEIVPNIIFQTKRQLKIQDPIVPNSYYEKTFIDNGPLCKIECKSGENMNVKVYIKSCAKNYNFETFCVRFKDNGVEYISPEVFIGTTSRKKSDEIPHMMTLSRNEIDTMKQKKVGQKRKRSENEKYFEVDTETDLSSSDSEEEEEDNKEFFMNQINALKKEIKDLQKKKFDAQQKKIESLQNDIKNQSVLISSFKKEVLDTLHQFKNKILEDISLVHQRGMQILQDQTKVQEELKVISRHTKPIGLMDDCDFSNSNEGDSLQNYPFE